MTNVKPKKLHTSVISSVIKWIVVVIFTLYAITLIFPLLWMAANSLKSAHDFVFTGIWSLPKTPVFSNYSQAFSLKVKNFTVLKMFFNSLFISVVATVLTLAQSSMAAYVIAKYKFKLKNFIYAVAVSIMLIPTVGSTAATYKLLNQLHLYNTYIGLFLLYAGGFGLSFLLLHAFFKNISWSYAEAAKADGASNFRVFIQIMLPQARAVLVSLAIIQFIGFWNDYFTPYLFLTAKPTLSLGIEKLVATLSNNAPVAFALMFVSVVPVLIIFIVFQKTIMNNTTTGGLKG